MNLLCGVDANGKTYPLGIHYDHGTGLASLAISRGAGKNTFAGEYATELTGTVIINPAPTQKVCVASVYVSGDGAAGVVSLDFADPAKQVYKHYMTKYNHSFASGMHREGALNQNLRVTTTTGTDKVFIIVNYRLVS